MWDNYRHFNRDLNQSPEQGLAAYNNYIQKEVNIYNAQMNVKKIGWSNCKKALDTIGRRLHTWQDFFEHAYHPTYQWNAWQNGVGGTPSAMGALRPSSYSFYGGGQHPGRSPVPFDPNERQLRYAASLQYTRVVLDKYINEWLKKCKGCCEK